jgi:hypothetical protein
MGFLPRIGTEGVGTTPAGDDIADTTVELWAAALPVPLAAVAWHYWFVVSAPGETAGARTRVEVWQTKNAGGTSVGHVHRGLMRPESGVGCGPASLRASWTGEAARALVDVLTHSFETYPHRDRYAAWPGPNSNTYVAWALEEAARAHPPLAAEARTLLDPRAVGKDWAGRWGVAAGRLVCGRGWRVASPLAGVRAWRDGRSSWGVEASLLGLTLLGAEGGDASPAALLTPFGRLLLGRRQTPAAARTAKSRSVSV